MRARHRHFNARDAGAALCLDARFISGLSDGNAVSTWSDRSRNAADAVQNTAANQPEYKTAIQGGQPVVRFSGSADANADFFPMTTPLASVLKNIGFGLILATAQDRTPTGGASGHTIFYASTNAPALARLALRTRSIGGSNFQSLARRVDGDSGSSASAANNSSWHIFGSECDFSNNNNRLRVDYSSLATATLASGGGNTSNTDSANVEIGSGNNNSGANAAPIDLGQLVVLNEARTEALVKRLHHHAAYSFKISCN